MLQGVVSPFSLQSPPSHSRLPPSLPSPSFHSSLPLLSPVSPFSLPSPPSHSRLPPHSRLPLFTPVSPFSLPSPPSLSRLPLLSPVSPFSLPSPPLTPVSLFSLQSPPSLSRLPLLSPVSPFSLPSPPSHSSLPLLPLQTVSKYNSQYHKLFQTVPKEEILMKVYSCALLRDILLQGRLYISRNWLCFYANLFGKDIKVAIPVVSVRLVKKHRTAGLVPNGLAITVDTSQKYVFVSLLSRDSVYDVLKRICTHLQVNGKKSLSLKQYLEEPSSLSMDEFPVVNDFPPVLKWRRKPSIPSSSSLPDLLGNSTSSLSAVDTPFLPTEVPLTLKSKIKDRGLETEKIHLTEPVPELGQMEYQLLKFFILLIILLIMSSCYLAFRVCSLEQQLSFLNTHPTLPLRER
uniref:GRAM domain-containing protein n=1 Tax=Esox lucius TaxID=8010 RepID=A0A3P8XA15_ESOLU